MIRIWKQRETDVVQSAILEKNCWIEVTKPDSLEIETLEREYGIERDFINDVLDIDERPRSEREEGAELIIFRIPVYNPEREVPYFTVPLGVVLARELIITICSMETDLVGDFRNNRVKNIAFYNFHHFLLQLFLRGIMYYLRYLKEINRQTSIIEKDLQQSVRNTELIRLLTLEKSLVYFTTSLRANELLIQRLQRRNAFKENEEITDLSEDVVTENRQAIEMANVYSNILSGMMDAFASVISNNLNVVMKRLTMISIILMIPTLFASLYGMNVQLPWEGSRFAFIGIVGVSVVFAAIGTLLFMKNNIKSRRKRRADKRRLKKSL